MIDAKFEKALNRFAEIGGGKFTKIPEMVTRAQSKVNVLNEELEQEMTKKPINEEIIKMIKVRLVIALRELDSFKRVKGA